MQQRGLARKASPSRTEVGASWAVPGILGIRARSPVRPGDEDRHADGPANATTGSEMPASRRLPSWPRHQTATDGIRGLPRTAPRVFIGPQHPGPASSWGPHKNPGERTSSVLREVYFLQENKRSLWRRDGEGAVPPRVLLGGSGGALGGARCSGHPRLEFLVLAQPVVAPDVLFP